MPPKRAFRTVDETKTLTYALLGRPGLDAQRAQVEEWLGRKDPRFVL